MRRYAAASILVAAALYGGVSGRWAAAAAMGAAIVAASLSPRRIAIGRAGARAIDVAAAALGLAADWILPIADRPEQLRRPWTSIALAALSLGAARILVREKPAAGREGEAAAEERASPFSFLPGLIAIMACGEVEAGPLYGVAAALWLSFALLSLRAGDGGRPKIRDLPRRDRGLIAALFALTLAIAAGAVAGLPPLSRWTERAILRSLGGDETGFSDRIWLGSLDGLLDSDEVVMRIEGPGVDYLRGAVFDHYEIGRWGRLHPLRPRRVDAAAEEGGADRVRVSVVSGARDRYFLPAGARAIRAEGVVSADRFGVLRLAGGGAASQISFARGGPADFPAEDPTPDDLDVPASLRRPIARIAAEWTAGAETPEAKVSAIAAHLGRDFTYARTFQRRRADPILDFLLDDHRGHCEYFATATALLARAAGVPARVVIGYRVAEENAIGRYWIVREKNAHAWTEVYLPGRGFVTVDTTPADPLAQNAPHRASFAGAILDVAAAAWVKLKARVTILDLAPAGAIVIAAGLLARWIRRPARARAKEERARAAPPPPSLVALLEALRRIGTARAESEPIEQLAARVEDAEVAAVLRRWAAYRYGGVGDGEALARDTTRLAAALRR